MNVVIDDFGVVALHMAKHAVHEFGALQAFDIAGPVIDIGRRHQLTTLLNAGDHDGFQVGTSGVYGCGVSGGAGAQYQYSAMLWVAHVYLSPCSLGGDTPTGNPIDAAFEEGFQGC